jgi:hypothetical protein
MVGEEAPQRAACYWQKSSKLDFFSRVGDQPKAGLGGVPNLRIERGEGIGITGAKRGGRMLLACN